MPQDGTRDSARADLEHQQAVQLAERRARRQVAVLARQYPDHMISTENLPGRALRFIARARPGTGARPWLVITCDPGELRAALPTAARHQGLGLITGGAPGADHGEEPRPGADYRPGSVRRARSSAVSTSSGRPVSAHSTGVTRSWWARRKGRAPTSPAASSMTSGQCSRAISTG